MKYTGSNGTSSQVTVSAVGNSNFGAGVNCTGNSGGTMTGYVGGFNGSTTGIVIYRVDAGAFTNIASNTVGTALASGHKVRLARDGADVVLYRDIGGTETELLRVAANTSGSALTGGESGIFTYDPNIRFSNWTDAGGGGGASTVPPTVITPKQFGFSAGFGR